VSGRYLQDTAEDAGYGARLAVFIVSAILVLWLGLSAIGLIDLRFWAPRREAARREVWQQTPSYVLGKATYLARLKGEWMVADSAHKEALCFVARHEAASIDRTLLPVDIQDWSCTQ
jgi:hypothetical protein